MVNTIQRCFLVLMLAALAALPSVTLAQQPLSAFVDQTNITINDVITLTLRLDVSLGNTKPQLTGLNINFEQVGGLSSRSTYTNTNGNIQAWTEYSLMLRPLSTGTLTIPAFRIGSQTTDPITITVRDAASGTVDNDNEIFLKTSISKTESYVQEQLLFTIRIYYSIGFDQGAQLSAPDVQNAVVQQLGSDNNFQEVLNGISYNVTERRFVMFPQQSGEFVIPPIFFNATVGRRGGINRFFNTRTAVREINLESESHTVNVKPQPDTFDGLTWLPAADLKLEETWSGDLDNIHVGDAITRNVTLTTKGLSSSLLPGVEYQDLPGLRFYPDQPVREDSADANGVTGKRSEGTAIVASQSGEFVLPEVKLPWWNTVEDRLEIATLPARTIMVLPALNGTGSAAPTVAPGNLPVVPESPDGGSSSVVGGNPLWITTTVIFAALWAFTTLMLLRSRHQLAYVETTGVPQPQVRLPEAAIGKTGAVTTANGTLPDANTSLRVLKTACDGRNLTDIRRALLKWAQGALQNPEVLTLEQVAQSCNDAELSTLLRALDQSLYGGASGENFDPKALYERVAVLHKQGIKPVSAEDKYALRPLYKI